MPRCGITPYNQWFIWATNKFWSGFKDHLPEIGFYKKLNDSTLRMFPTRPIALTGYNHVHGRIRPLLSNGFTKIPSKHSVTYKILSSLSSCSLIRSIVQPYIFPATPGV